YADDEATDDRAGDRALAAGQRGAPDDDRGDRVELITESGVRLSGVQPCRHHDAGKPAESTARHIHCDRDAGYVEAGQSCRALAAAQGVQMSSERRSAAYHQA